MPLACTSLLAALLAGRVEVIAVVLDVEPHVGGIARELVAVERRGVEVASTSGPRASPWSCSSLAFLPAGERLGTPGTPGLLASVAGVEVGGVERAGHLERPLRRERNQG
ncbi:hypothetical protein KEG57_52820 [Polyangium jinanense]|uniref:Uncharacterized protein n=1 Tax=Polyangium jinanense TaxID=2829994 RepID=A0A9X4AYX9_9BACT|nr:hypothetical protein [Polyangium jinanense]